MPEETTPDPTPDIMERMRVLETKVAALEASVPRAMGEATYAATIAPVALVALIRLGAMSREQAAETIDRLMVKLEERHHPLPPQDRAMLDHARSRLSDLIAQCSAIPQ